MRVLIIGYTKTDTYEEFKDYIQNRKYFTTGDYVPTKHMFISKSGVTIEHISLRQHCRDALQQYTKVDVSPLALKNMKPSDLEWIQALMKEV
ncbi:hypothetical protein [Pediococcus pentosaceus]|uniref:hypothetical protein n=1 Tax=Pediococcus pentosaceus TaxID=1255 RepID=UPI000CFF7F6A|nr:hypothetical protein [Pediococcus pentosaceus]AVL02855.1 hypothetical protein PP40703_08650 [Pediococcus pentosaceus]MBF7133644.1 hypothetical protein [Pediococcus pentosaceus]QPT36980.1 hypothetical protein I6G30_03495 [Pediococcus pentosaceus]QYY85665.1 hypothetical protein GRI00_03610 [Pediococcus pentosaceus]